MAYTRALLCVVMIYVLSLSAIGIHGQRIKRVEDRVTKIEIRQDRESASRREDRFDMIKKLDEIKTFVNDSLAGQTSFEPGATQTMLDDESLGSIADDVLILKKAFVEEKARWRREAGQMENAIKGLKTGVNTTINGITTGVNNNIDALEKTIQNDIKNMESSLSEKVTNDIKYMESSLSEKVTNDIENMESLLTAKVTNDIKLVEKSVQQVTDDVNNVENVVDKLKTTMDNSIKELREEILLALKDSVKDAVANAMTAIQPSSCLDMYNDGKRSSGAYTIYPEPDKQPLKVYCDMETDGGGWTVFQRRQDGSEDFYRGWVDYASGFGDVDGEFWLGNEYINKLTSTCCHELRVDLEDTAGKTTFAKYSAFSVQSSASNYRLEVSGYSGDAGDALTYHDGMQFSTKDRENDKHTSIHCAKNLSGGAWWYNEMFTGAWWYNACYRANLNGMYTDQYKSKRIRWRDSQRKYSIFNRSEMKFRKKT